jgi:hypothetical protein
VAAYTFLTRWRVAAPIDDVFVTIANLPAWPEWWRGVGVRTIERTDDGRGNGGVGSRFALTFRSRLPYSLRFEMRVTEIERPTALAGEASGELRGEGRWTFSPSGDATDVTYRWDVETTRWWMNLLAPIARPIFADNHDVIMGWGREGLARRLGVEVALVEAQSGSGSGSSRGAPTGI